MEPLFPMSRMKLPGQTISRCRSETSWHTAFRYGRGVIILHNSKDDGSPTTTRTYARNVWRECGGIALTTCIIFHSILSADYISSRSTGFTMHTRSFCKHYLLRIELIQLPTINGSVNRWRRS